MAELGSSHTTPSELGMLYSTFFVFLVAQSYVCFLAPCDYLQRNRRDQLHMGVCNRLWIFVHSSPILALGLALPRSVPDPRKETIYQLNQFFF